MNFEEELSKGNFCLPECNKCKKIVWPPSEFCNNCFGEIHLKKEKLDGAIIEFSKHKNSFFCVVEFEGNIKIMAKCNSIPTKGQKVRIDSCGIENGSYFFYVS